MKKCFLHRRFAVVTTLVALTITAGCGRDDDKSPTPGIGNDPNFELTGSSLIFLDEWIASPRKVCSAASIFGTADERQARDASDAGIDAVWLYDRLEGQLNIVANSGSMFARLAPQGGMSGGTTYETSTNINGAETRFESSTKSDGINCEVLVNGKPIRTLAIYSSIDVRDAYHSGKKISPPTTYVGPPRRANALDDLGVIDHLISSYLKPTAEDIAWVTEHLSLPTEHNLVVALAPGYGLGEERPVYTFPDVKSIPPATTSGYQLSSDRFMVVGTPAEIAMLRMQEQSYQSLYHRGYVVSGFPGDLPEDRPDQTGLAEIAVTLTFKREQPISDHKVTLKSLAALPPRQISADAQLACANDRLDRLLEGDANRHLVIGEFYPTRGSATDACEAMKPGFAVQLATTKAGRSFLQRVFVGTKGSKDRGRFFGWDDLLYNVGSHALTQGGPLASHMDPKRTLPIVTAADKYLAAIRAFTSDNPSEVVFDGTEERMALSWSLSGYAVSQNTLKTLLSSALNISDPFADAARDLLSDATRDLDAAKEDVVFAASVDEELKDAARSVMKKAEGLESAETFVAKKVAKVVKEKVGLKLWNQYSMTLDALLGFINKETSRIGGDSGAQFEFDGDIDNLVSKAMEESWSDADFTTLDAIAGLARRDSFCERKATTTSAVDCFASDAVTKDSEGFLAPAYGDRYRGLTSVFATAMDKLSDSSFFAIQRELLSAFKGPVWKTCSNSEFEAKKSQFISQSNRLVSADFMDRFEVERQLDKTLDDCD